MTLRSRAVASLAAAEVILAEPWATERLRQEFRAHRLRFEETLRIALVGRISSGKSTLTNALLGGHKVATGTMELTYNVNWLRHGSPPRLEIHYTDGRPSEQARLDDLERFTVRPDEESSSPGQLSQSNDIEYIEVFDSSEFLDTFDVIDTPGLSSTYGLDSAKTERFLSRRRPDALVFVFEKGIHAESLDLLARFTGQWGTSANPLSVIGVLTKSDKNWAQLDHPMAHWRENARKLMKPSSTRRLLFGIQPVAGLLASAAATLSEREYAELATLARIPADRFHEELRFEPGFKHADLGLDPGRSQALLERFSGYGLHVAHGVLGPDGDKVDRIGLRDELLRLSGIQDLRDLLGRHFVRRADLIKLQWIITDLHDLRERAGPGLSDRGRARLDQAIEKVTSLEHTEYAFREIAVLRDLRIGAVELDEFESAQLSQACGADGTTAAARLGLRPDASIEELLGQARERRARWAELDVSSTRPRRTRDAIRVGHEIHDGLVGWLESAGEPAFIQGAEPW